MRTSFVISTVVVALVLLLQPPAFAQENPTKRYVGGFVVIGDDFPEVHIPMTALERELFVDITDLLLEAQRRAPETQGYLADVRGTSLLSVKINKKGNILVNLDKNLLPKYWGYEIEDFLRHCSKDSGL